MAASRKTTYFLLGIGALGVLVASFYIQALLPSASMLEIPQRLLWPVVRREAKRPILPADLTSEPIEVQEFLDRVERTEVREFLSRVLAKVPANGTGVANYQFKAWNLDGKPTQESLALKPIREADTKKLMACILDVDGPVYSVNLFHSPTNV